MLSKRLRQEQGSDRPMPTPGDHYEHPTPQLIHIRGKTSVINISVPLLQQYYINMNMNNQDYAYFQVTYYDIPQFDSPSRILGTFLPVEFQYQYQIFNRNTAQYESQNQSLILTIDLTGVRNCEQLAYAIRAALFKQTYDRNATIDNNDTSRYVFNQLYDFRFDSASQKFVAMFAPSSSLSYSKDNSGNHITYVSFTLASKSVGNTLTQQQAQFAAALFGGTSDGTTWSSTFQYEQLSYTGNSSLSSLWQKVYNSTDENIQYSFRNFTALNAYSINCPRFQVDDYVYIRGAPEASIWNTDGTSTDYAAILPRNRGYNSNVQVETAYLSGQTYEVKTSLSSMRVMKLVLTDQSGNPLEFDEDYIIGITIHFNID